VVCSSLFLSQRSLPDTLFCLNISVHLCEIRHSDTFIPAKLPNRGVFPQIQTQMQCSQQSLKNRPCLDRQGRQLGKGGRFTYPSIRVLACLSPLSLLLELLLAWVSQSAKV
jgi:hypothetical protein